MQKACNERSLGALILYRRSYSENFDCSAGLRDDYFESITRYDDFYFKLLGLLSILISVPFDTTLELSP
jgi:hypothetical protein